MDLYLVFCKKNSYFAKQNKNPVFCKKKKKKKKYKKKKKKKNTD